MKKYRLGIGMMLALLFASFSAEMKAQDGTVVFDGEIYWEWPIPQDYGGYGFYWWHRNEGTVNINYGDMSSTDWTSPENFYNGEFVMRFEVLEQPTSEPFKIQFGIWQDKYKGADHPETVASKKYVPGGEGSVFEGSLGTPSTWWNRQPDDLVDFSRPEDFYRIGIVLWNEYGTCFPKGPEWGDDGCPEIAPDYFPMRARVTVTAYPSTSVAKYTTSFVVKDESSVAVEGANISINGNNLTTNSSGEAQIDLINGNYNYTVSKSGFKQKSGSLNVSGSNVTENVTLTRTHTVKFDVKEADETAVGNANISIDGKNLSTNSAGEASLNLIDDTYNYTVSKSGFEEETGSVTVAGSAVTETVVLTPQTYNVSFNVTDESSTAIQGANISINGNTITTDTNGDASINLPNGNYSYTVSKDGFEGYPGSISVTGDDVPVDITMSESSYTVLFNVNMEGSEEPLGNANISIDGNDLLTNTEGNASVSLPNGEYPYTITLSGYEEETGSIIVSGSNVTEDVALTQLTYSLSFNVRDENTDPLQGAVITVNETELTTDQNGDASVNLPDGDYPYTVSKDGYGNESGSVTISGTNFTENVVLTTTKYTLTFSVTDENSDPIEGATIEVNQTTLSTNAAGEVSIDLVNGDYPYSVTHPDYDIITGIASIAGTDQTELITLPYVTYTITFIVKDENNDPVEDANVSIDGNNLITDQAGEVSIDLSDDIYPYTVSKEGYEDNTGDLTVSGQALTEEVELVEVKYTLYFDVTDSNDDPVEDAIVNVNATAINTDANGDASIELVNESYDYTVTKDGYDQVFGSVTISGADLTENVSLSLTNYLLTFIITSPDANGIEGATVSVNGNDLATDSNGVAAIELTNGEYDYSVSKEGFEDTTSTLTISSENLTLNLTMDVIGSVSISNSQSISVFPNPASGMIFVESTSGFSADTEFNLYSITGEKIFSEIDKGSAGRISLNLTNVPDGVYFLQIRSEDEVMTRKVVVRR